MKKPMKKTRHPTIAAVRELEKKLETNIAYDVADMKNTRK